MIKNIDNIIKECFNNLIETKIDVKKDKVVSDAQKRVLGHMKDLAKRGDRHLLDIMQSKGYNGGMNTKDAQNLVDNLYSKDNGLSDDINQEIIDIAKILQDYTINGSVRFKELKQDYPNKYDYIIRMKNFMDLKGLTYMYDKSANVPTIQYGDWVKTGNLNDFSFNNISDKEVKKYRGEKIVATDIARATMQSKILTQYITFKYGVKLDIPSITFSNGNAKLPDNTLIINFTSALNCPAWNECLVKHACYARAGEKRNPTVFNSNENRSLYWLTTEHDEKLLKLMMDFVRTYCFNYTKVAEKLIKNNIVKSNNANSLALKISKLPLDDSFFTTEIIEIMKEFKRIDNIRLNENGDFIGQWLVDAWDNEAGLYQPYDVGVSAYTCKHLNYEGIKNIILNTSFQNGKGNVARRFIALPEKVYNALDETYGGKNNELVFKSNNINPNPQPLYDVDDNNSLLSPNGKLYYKCPCGRELGKTKINCYQCSLCYQPKSENSDLFVFVCAHGSAKEKLNGYDLIKNKIGVSKNFFNKYNVKMPQIKESVSDNNFGNIKMAENNGIKGVTNNAISSIYEHFNQLKSNNVNESHVIKLTENELIDIIKDTVSHFIK